MLQHRDHEYTDALALVDPSKVLLQESRAVCEDLSERVEEVASRVQAVMADLNSDTNECAQQIENAFAALRKTLVSREKALLSRLKSIADRKKSALSAQLDRLRDLSAECCDLVSCTDALIDAGCRPEDENGGIYMVNTAHYVRQRSHVLKMQYDSMPLAPVADPDILCHLNSNTMESVTVALRTFGWLGTVDNAPSEAKRSERDAKSTGNKEEPLEMEAKAAEAKGEVESSGSFSIPLAITLELKSG